MDKAKLEQLGYISLGKNIDNEELMVKAFEGSCTIYTIGHNSIVENVLRISDEQIKQLQAIQKTS